ncbi:MAG: deoxyribonuclease IV, partial [Firmicutes bacterium]|nr:deoxyribonuclease IV [Bacillota bacterium]
MGSLRVGVHVSIAGGLRRSLERAHALGCTALQIFSTSPRMWPTRRSARNWLSAAEAENFRVRRAELGLGPLVVHDNYLINLASLDRAMHARSVRALREELARAVLIGAEYLVLHPGNAGAAPLEHAIRTVAAGLRQATHGLTLGPLRILLENTAGQGSAIGWRFEHLEAILRACPELPLGVCLDTAHTFAAGYDITSETGLERTLAEFSATIGFDRLLVVHVNDSKAPAGSRVDRHEHIGRGKIGLENFRRFLNHPWIRGFAG